MVPKVRSCCRQGRRSTRSARSHARVLFQSFWTSRSEVELSSGQMRFRNTSAFQNTVSFENHGLNFPKVNTNFLVGRREFQIIGQRIDHAQRLAHLVDQFIESYRMGIRDLMRSQIHAGKRSFLRGESKSRKQLIHGRAMSSSGAPDEEEQSFDCGLGTKVSQEIFTLNSPVLRGRKARSVMVLRCDILRT